MPRANTGWVQQVSLPDALRGYACVRGLGRGSSADVIHLRHIAGEVPDCALKVMVGKVDPAARVRFLREALWLGRAQHEHVVRLMSADHDTHGRPYLLLEVIEGLALDQHLRSFRTCTSACLQLLAELVESVQRLHDLRIIHGDLKPQHALVRSERQQAWPVLIDLGSACAFGAPIGRVGSYPYLAPERRNGEVAAQPAQDVYSLGVIVANALGTQAGRNAELPMSTRSSLNGTASILGMLEKRMQALVTSATHTQPRQRPTAGQMAVELRELARMAGASQD